jgi:hypothetical protein
LLYDSLMSMRLIPAAKLLTFLRIGEPHGTR